MLYDSSTASKIAPELGQVQETLLIPLYARARDAARRHPVLNYDHGRGSSAATRGFDYSECDAATEFAVE